MAAIDAYRFPAAVRQRLASEHDNLSQPGLDQVESATRQWFRLVTRHPRAKLTMPSVIATPCGPSCPARPPNTPPSAPRPSAARRPAGRPQPGRPDRPTRSGSPCGDENCGPATLLLLFRVDQQLAIPGGNRYLPDCGGRGTCYDQPSALCLHHLKGTGRLVRGRNPYGPPPPGHSGPGSSGEGLTCGGGCGSP